MEALERLPSEVTAKAQEIRVRAGQPLTVSLPQGDRYVCADGVTTLRQRGLIVCSPAQVERCFLRFCEDSVYAHQWELCRGYIAVPGGIRVGIAGRAVMHQGEIASVQAVTSLCVRLPRRLDGCAAPLLEWVTPWGYPVNALLIGEPSSGKTTLLRDLAVQLARCCHRVTVVDERGELTGLETLEGCDVLLGYPKAEGIRQAVRCLAPEVILFDELGEEAEAQAVAACAHAGVAVMATLHGRTPQEMAHRPIARMLMACSAFDRWVFLAGRGNPGVVNGCYQPEVCGDGVRWMSVDSAGRDRSGVVGCRSAVAPGDLFGADQTIVAGSAPAGGVLRPPHDRIVATAGVRGDVW